MSDDLREDSEGSFSESGSGNPFFFAIFLILARMVSPSSFPASPTDTVKRGRNILRFQDREARSLTGETGAVGIVTGFLRDEPLVDRKFGVQLRLPERFVHARVVIVVSASGTYWVTGTTFFEESKSMNAAALPWLLPMS